MNVNEQFEFNKGCKTSRLFLNKLDDLILVDMGMYI
jgi:hypothetical protein